MLMPHLIDGSKKGIALLLFEKVEARDVEVEALLVEMQQMAFLMMRTMRRQHDSVKAFPF
jgi:hypothetical protein